MVAFVCSWSGRLSLRRVADQAGRRAREKKERRRCYHTAVVPSWGSRSGILLLVILAKKMFEICTLGVSG